ncbi:MAG: hypothetical protein ACE5ID_01865 [Acidobacteriota bacterium]
MNHEKGQPRSRPENWRLLLKRGDPAADGQDPAPEEASGWLRDALKHLKQLPPQTSFLHHLLASPRILTAAAVLVMVSALGLFFIGSQGPSLQHPAGEGPGSVETMEQPGGDSESLKASDLAAPFFPATWPPSRSAGRQQRRTIQLVAPGGTRIVWTLDSEYRPLGS